MLLGAVVQEASLFWITSHVNDDCQQGQKIKVFYSCPATPSYNAAESHRNETAAGDDGPADEDRLSFLPGPGTTGAAGLRPAVANSSMTSPTSSASSDIFPVGELAHQTPPNTTSAGKP
jgi:hypothetical protein